MSELEIAIAAEVANLRADPTSIVEELTRLSNAFIGVTPICNLTEKRRLRLAEGKPAVEQAIQFCQDKLGEKATTFSPAMAEAARAKFTTPPPPLTERLESRGQWSGTCSDFVQMGVEDLPAVTVVALMVISSGDPKRQIRDHLFSSDKERIGVAVGQYKGQTAVSVVLATNFVDGPPPAAAAEELPAATEAPAAVEQPAGDASNVEESGEIIYSVGDVVEAKWDEDGSWYQASVDQVTEFGFWVTFTEYGNSQDTAPQNVRAIPGRSYARVEMDEEKRNLMGKLAALERGYYEQPQAEEEDDEYVSMAGVSAAAARAAPDAVSVDWKAQQAAERAAREEEERQRKANIQAAEELRKKKWKEERAAREAAKKQAEEERLARLREEKPRFGGGSGGYAGGGYASALRQTAPAVSDLSHDPLRAAELKKKEEAEAAERERRAKLEAAEAAAKNKWKQERAAREEARKRKEEERLKRLQEEHDRSQNVRFGGGGGIRAAPSLRSYSEQAAAPAPVPVNASRPADDDDDDDDMTEEERRMQEERLAALAALEKNRHAQQDDSSSEDEEMKALQAERMRKLAALERGYHTPTAVDDDESTAGVSAAAARTAPDQVTGGETWREKQAREAREREEAEKKRLANIAAAQDAAKAKWKAERAAREAAKKQAEEERLARLQEEHERAQSRSFGGQRTTPAALRQTAPASTAATPVASEPSAESSALKNAFHSSETDPLKREEERLLRAMKGRN